MNRLRFSYVKDVSSTTNEFLTKVMQPAKKSVSQKELFKTYLRELSQHDNHTLLMETFYHNFLNNSHICLKMEPLTRLYRELKQYDIAMRQNYIFHHDVSDFAIVRIVLCSFHILFIGFSSGLKNTRRSSFRSPTSSASTSWYPLFYTEIQQGHPVESHKKHPNQPLDLHLQQEPNSRVPAHILAEYANIQHPLGRHPPRCLQAHHLRHKALQPQQPQPFQPRIRPTLDLRVQQAGNQLFELFPNTHVGKLRVFEAEKSACR